MHYVGDSEEAVWWRISPERARFTPALFGARFRQQCVGMLPPHGKGGTLSLLQVALLPAHASGSP
jgi:hypothetical protein